MIVLVKYLSVNYIEFYFCKIQPPRWCKYTAPATALDTCAFVQATYDQLLSKFTFNDCLFATFNGIGDLHGQALVIKTAGKLFGVRALDIT